MVGAIIPAKGEFVYIAPAFEVDTLEGFMVIEGKVNTWHEDESSYALFGAVLKQMGINSGKVGIDESAAFFIFDGVKSPKVLELNDTVLIDTGCQLQGYKSDITRTFVFGTPSARQRELWQYERDAQIAAFDAAKM